MNVRTAPNYPATFAEPFARGVLLQSAVAQKVARRAILFVAILLSGGNLLLPRLPLLAIFLVGSLAVLNPTKFARPELGRVWMFLLVILIVSLIGSEGFYLQATATRYANFLAALILLLVYLDLPRSALVSDLVPLSVFFAFQAILTPLAALLVPELFTTIDVADQAYHTLAFLLTYHDTVITAIKRPDGFFFEPGVLQIYLNLYLFIALFLLRRPMHIGLALAAVLATQSTTGIIIAMILCSAAAWQYLRGAGYNSRIIGVIIAPILLVPLALTARDNLDSKLVGALSGSTDARQYDFQIGVRMVEEYPVFGIGFDFDRYRDIASRLGNFQTDLTKEAADQRTSSNGILLLMAMLGIPMFLAFAWGIARQRILPHRWVVFALLFLSLVGEALVFTPVFMLFILSAFLTPRARPANA